MKKKIFYLFTISLFTAMNLFAGQINYTYDFAGRLTKVDYGNGRTIQYTYDNNGNILSITSTSQDHKSPQVVLKEEKEKKEN